MLAEYEKIMPVTYRILKQAISKDELAHAYILENKNVSNLEKFMKAVIMEILCDKQKHKQHDYKTCSICQAIINNNYTEVKYIYPDGINIKKEQLISLQSEFNNKALVGQKKIYVIYEADKLNDSSANTILKFLEEPKDGVIAFLVTNNINNLLDTIISRCRIIPLFENGQADNIYSYLNYNNKYSNEEINNLIQFSIEFINFYEKNGIKTILFMQRMWHQNFKDKEQIDIGMNTIILFYKEILNIKNNKKILLFKEYEKLIKQIADKNEKEEIINKINIVMDIKNRKNYNVNNNLLMDKFILMMEGGS